MAVQNILDAKPEHGADPHSMRSQVPLPESNDWIANFDQVLLIGDRCILHALCRPTVAHIDI
jgi:hypothetical protein